MGRVVHPFALDRPPLGTVPGGLRRTASLLRLHPLRPLLPGRVLLPRLRCRGDTVAR